MQQEPTQQPQDSLDFSDILGPPTAKLPKDAQLPAQAAGVDFSDILGPAKTPERPIAPPDVTQVYNPALERAYLDQLPQNVIRPARPAIVEHLREVYGLGKQLLVEPGPIASIGGGLIEQAKQIGVVGQDILKRLMMAPTVSTTDLKAARMERAYATIEGKLTPELEEYVGRLERLSEARRGTLAFAASAVTGTAAAKLTGSALAGAAAGGATYPIIAREPGAGEPIAGRAIAFALAALPIGFAAARLHQIRKMSLGDAADHMAQLKQAEPFAINDEPPSPQALGLVMPKRLSKKSPSEMTTEELNAELIRSGLPPVPSFEGYKAEIAELETKMGSEIDAAFAAKKLADFDPINVRAAIMRGASEIGDGEQVIIPGIDKESFFRGLQGWPKDVKYVVHERLDGKLDVMTYKKGSALDDVRHQEEFEAFGWFVGQEAIWRGKPVRIADLPPVIEGRAFIELGSMEEVTSVPVEELQRPTYASPYQPIIPQFTAREVKPSLESTWEDFNRFYRDIDNGKIEGRTTLPDVSDISSKYPDAFQKASEFADPREGLAAFADALSDMVASREIPPEIAESLGERMRQYLAARSINEISTSFDGRVRLFMGFRGLPPSEFNSYHRYLANKLGEQLRQQGLEPEEYSLFNEVAAKVARQEIGLTELGATNGYLIDHAPVGYFIRDSNGELLAYADTPEQVRSFVNKSGASTGPSLDGGGKDNIVPPGAIGGPAMPPSGPPPRAFNVVDDELHAPYEPHVGWSEKLASGFRLLMPAQVIKREAIFQALDSKFGTRLWERFFQPLENSLKNWRNKAIPFHNELVATEKKFKLSSEQWDMVGDAVQHFTADELRAGRGFSRHYTQAELNLANQLGGMKIDMQRVFQYRRAIKDANESLTGQALVDQLSEIERAFALDADHRTASNIFDFIESQHIGDVSLGMVTRLAHAIMTNEVGRQQFMSQNNFTPTMRAAVSFLDDFGQRIGDAGGIDIKQLLNGYIPHYRLNPTAPTAESAFIFQRGWRDTPEGKFLSEMTRTNEIDAYEKNPIIAFMRYTNALFKSREFMPIYREAMKAAEEEWNKLPSNLRRKAFHLIDSFAVEVSGRPNEAVAFAQGVFDKTLEQMHVDVHPSIRKDFINTWAALIYTSGIGFRPSMLLQDVNMYLTLGGARWGPRMLGSAIYWGSKGLKDFALVEQARREGMVTPLEAQAFLTRDELQATGLSDKINKLEDLAFKIAHASMTINGVKSVYELTQFGYGMAMKELASKVISDIRFGKISKKAGYRQLKLDTFPVAVGRAFDLLVREGKFSEASLMIARQAAKETTFQYGLAGHPQGWATNAGRLIGIYGVWPTWMQDYTLQMLSRGSPATRAAWIARYAAIQGSVYVTARAMGLNPSYLMMGPGFFFDGPWHGTFYTLAPGIVQTAGGPVLGGLVESWAQSSREPDPGLRDMYRKRLWRQLVNMGIPGRGLYNDWFQASNDPRVQTAIQFWARTVGVKPENFVTSPWWTK